MHGSISSAATPAQFDAFGGPPTWPSPPPAAAAASPHDNDNKATIHAHLSAFALADTVPDGWHWSDEVEAEPPPVMSAAPQAAPFPFEQCSLSTFEQAVADQAPRLLAMVARRPELAHEAAEKLPSLFHLNMGMELVRNV